MIKIEHPICNVSFVYIDRNTSNIYNYIFRIEKGLAKIYCIQLFEKCGKSSHNYKMKDVYHDVTCKGDGKIYNYSTNEYEEVEIHEEVLMHVKNYVKGFLINCI